MRRLLFSRERFEPGQVVNANITLWTVSGPTIMTQRKRSEEKVKVEGNEYVFAKKKRRERRKRTGNGIERKGYSGRVFAASLFL
jgi:hypothetical protein